MAACEFMCFVMAPHSLRLANMRCHRCWCGALTNCGWNRSSGTHKMVRYGVCLSPFHLISCVLLPPHTSGGFGVYHGHSIHTNLQPSSDSNSGTREVQRIAVQMISSARTAVADHSQPIPGSQCLHRQAHANPLHRWVLHGTYIVRAVYRPPFP